MTLPRNYSRGLPGLHLQCKMHLVPLENLLALEEARGLKVDWKLEDHWKPEVRRGECFLALHNPLRNNP